MNKITCGCESLNIKDMVMSHATCYNINLPITSVCYNYLLCISTATNDQQPIASLWYYYPNCTLIAIIIVIATLYRVRHARHNNKL